MGKKECGALWLCGEMIKILFGGDNILVVGVKLKCQKAFGGSKK